MVGIATAFVIAIGWSVLSIWVGPRIGLVDVPTASPLKIHQRPIPLLGGVGIFFGLHIGMLIEDAFDPGLFAASSIIIILGLIDDRLGLSPRLRLAVEVTASIVLLWVADTGLNTPVAVALGVVLVVIAINAVNLFDGLDGLVGSVTIISAFALGFVGSNGTGVSVLGFTLASAVAGFLLLNWSPARIFLGDNGAYLIGMVLAYGVLASGDGDIVNTLLLAMGALGVFLIDLATTILRRVRNKNPIFTGDRSHIYDHLRDRGLTVRAVAFLAASAQVLLAVIFIGLIR